MAEFNEHVLKVRAALDKGSQKDMRDVLRGIFTEEAHIDFNNPENMRGLRELAEAMKKVFTQAGNKKFDFTKMITLPGPEMFDELKKAAMEFNDVWNSIMSKMGGAGGVVAGGIADGIVSGVSAGVDAAVKNAEAKLDGLLKEQAAKIKKIDELTARQRKREDMAKRLDFDNAFEVEEKLEFTDDKDLKQKVRDIEAVYEDALFDLQGAADAGKLTEPILEKFKNAAREMLKARNTVAELAEEKIKKTVKQSGSMMQSSKFISKAEDIFGPSLVERLLGDENDAESLMSEIGQAMELFTEEFDLLGVREEISAVKKELVGIGNEIDRITAQHPELIDRKSAEEAEERLNRIHDAYERLFVTRGAKKGELNESKVKHIENTLAYKGHGDAIQDLPADATDQQLARHTKQSDDARKKLENAFRLYDESAAESWEKRAQYLIKAIAEYESILNNPNASKDLLGGYEDQYEKLRAQAAIEREKLEAVVAMARGSSRPMVADDSAKAADAARQAREEEEGRTKAAQQRKAVEDAIAKNKDKEETQSGGILNNPLFANMFKSSDAEETNDDLREQSELLENIQRLASYVDEEYLSAGKHLGDFLDDVQRDASGLDEELKDILTSLKLIDDTGKLQFDVKHAGEEGGGTTHNGALISKDFVLIERKNYEEVKNSQLPEGSGRAREDGINVANVLKYIPSLHTGGFFDVQRTAKGHNLFDGGMLSQDVVEATEDQLEQLVNAFIKARDYGFDIENGGSNIAYDNKEGFSFYDLSEYSGEDAEFWNKLDDDQKKLIAIENLFSLFSGLNRDHGNAKDDPNVTKLAERIKSIIEQRGIISPDAVDEDGRNYEDIYDDVFSGDIDQESDALMAMLEAIGQKRAQNNAEAEEGLKRQQTETQNLTEDVKALAAAEDERYDKLLKKKDAIATMHDTDGEAGAFYNSETGEFSDVIAGGDHSIKTEKSAWKKAAEEFDTRIHKHNYDVAAPSFSGEENDFKVWIDGFDIFKKQMILANKEILSFDFSSLESVDTLKEIARKYREGAMAVDAEFDDYFNFASGGSDRFKEKYGIEGTSKNMNEQLQVELRKVIDNVMANYQGVMTSIQLPTDMIKDTSTPKISEEKAEELRRDSIERYANAKATRAQTDAQKELNEVKAEGRKLSLEEKYDSSTDDIKKKYQDIVKLTDQIHELESQANVEYSEIDPYSATKEEKDKIVQAWREYQAVIQEISDMPIVKTEDDQKRLLALITQAKRLSMALHQGELNDATVDGYSRTYGLSMADAANMKVDAEHPYKRFDEMLDVLRDQLEALHDDAAALNQELFNELLGADYNTQDSFFEHIRQDALAAKPAVEAVNDVIEETKNAAQGTGTGTGTGDASSADLEAAQTKVEALQNEVDQKNQDLASKDAEIARVQAESDAKQKALDDEKTTLLNDLDNTRQQLKDVEHENNLYDSRLAEVTEESDSKDRTIYELREQLAGVKTGVSEEQASVSSEELKNVLSSIVYNVKIAHDDNDKTANKIAIDEGILESTLKRVFSNVLSPRTEQNDSEPKNEPWALEKTLQTVKSVLDGIQTNTAKSESVEVAPAKVEVGNVLATENTLAAIKTAVEAINKKAAKDHAPKQSNQKQPTTSGNRFTSTTDGGLTKADAKNLIKDYETLGRLRAKLENDRDEETKAHLQVLADEVARKRESMQLTTDEIIELRNKSNIAYEAEKKLLDAAKRKQKIEEEQKRIAEEKAAAEKVAADQQKKAEKDAKSQAANAKRMAQREAMLGKAGNAVGRAENTWMNAVGIEGELPDSFIADIDEYYKKLDALRKKHQELKNSDMISEEQKKELISQTMEVNKLTDEISGLISEYQKLSGDNATVIGTNTLKSDAGLDAYEQQLKQTVMTATNGKAQIKNFDAATKTLTYTVKTGKNEFTEYTAAVRRADDALVSVQGATKKTETFIEATMRKMKEISSYMSGMSIISRIGQELRRGIQYVREIDLALTELKKVTDETEETYDRFLDTAAKTADKVGSTIQKVVSSTADWARLGSILANTNIRPII